MPSLLDLIQTATARFTDAALADPAREARFVLSAALQISRADMVMQEDRELTEDEITAAETFITRRAAHEPLGRLEGGREFWGLWFEINKDTLEPRPDSETIIEATLKKLKERDQLDQPLRLLDLGTGTGCLLLALLSELPNAVGIGIDKAPAACVMANHNAETLKLDDRAQFLCDSWEDGLQTIAEEDPFDIILSNPPYIESQTLRALMPEVRDFDPLLALDGGQDGLDAYRQIVPLAQQHLTADGILVFEIGQGQETALTNILTNASFTAPEMTKDLGGVVRCLISLISSPI